jgi:hypothetical protein
MRQLRHLGTAILLSFLALCSCAGEPAQTSSSDASSTASSFEPALTLSVHELTMEVGESETLAIDTNLDGAPEWSSSDPDIVTVAEGIVIANDNGSATITAKIGDYSDSCAVTVSSEKTIEVAQSGEKLYVGGTLQLTPSLYFGVRAEEDEFEYSSSAENVATVDENGLVTGVKKGSVSIRVSSKSDPSVSTDVALSVQNRIRITLSKNSLTLYPNISGSLSATVSASVTKNGYSVMNAAFTIRVIDEAIATATMSGSTLKVTAKASGVTAVILTFEGETAAVSVCSYYGIRTVDDLKTLANDFHGHYVLLDDIDFNGAYWDPVSPWLGDYVPRDRYWNGVLDGRGHTIKNVSFASGWHRAIIGQTGEQAVVKNLSLVGIKQSATSNMVGSIVALNYGRIENCYVENEINGPSQSTYNAQGGFAAINGASGYIVNCIARLKVSQAYANTGAFIGYNWAKVENCLAIVDGPTLPFCATMSQEDSDKVKECYVGSKDEEEKYYDASWYRKYDKSVWTVTGKGLPSLKTFPEVSFDHDDLYFTIGRVYALNPCNVPGMKETWEFSDGAEDYFQIKESDGGGITLVPLSVGDVTCSVSLENGSEATATFHAKHKGITVGEEEIGLDYGNPGLPSTYSLSFSDEDGNAIPLSELTLTSGDTGVFTVSSDGLITASGGGSATLTLQYGSDVYEDFMRIDVNPWTGITDLAGLDAIRDDLSSDYVILNDIDGGGAVFETIGLYDGQESRHFAGTLDGNGHTVSNIEIRSGHDTDGLFGQTAATSVIRRVAFRGIKGPDATASNFGVVGFNEGLIEDCCFYMSVTSGGPTAVRGGGPITGTNEFRGVIRDCYAVVDATSLVTSEYFGSLIGLNQGSLTDCFSIVYGDNASHVYDSVTYENGYSAGLSVYKAATLDEAISDAISELSPFSDFSDDTWEVTDGSLPDLIPIS